MRIVNVLIPFHEIGHIHSNTQEYQKPCKIDGNENQLHFATITLLPDWMVLSTSIIDFLSPKILLFLHACALNESMISFSSMSYPTNCQWAL